MGLCPDCRSEGETVTYIGGSKDDVLNQGDEEDQDQAEETDASTDDESESEDLSVCDLCGMEYKTGEE